MDNQEKKDLRRDQLREAQKRWREKKRAQNQVTEKVEPVCYTKEYRISYHREYYRKNKDKIREKYRSIQAAKKDQCTKLETN
jgi:hypothetical protein